MKRGVLQKKQDRVSRVPEAAMLVAGSCLVIAIAFLSYRSAQQRGAAAGQLKITQEIQDASTALLLNLVDAETGQRGFLLTGRDEYLEPYNRAVSVIPGILGQLRQASVSREVEAGLVNALEPLVARKLEELAKTIDLRRTGGEAAAMAEVDTGRGKAMMDQIRAISTEIRNTTVARSAAYSAAAEHGTERLNLVSSLGAVLLLAFLGLSAVTIFRGMARREELFYEAAANAATLQVTLTSIGDAVIATDSAGKITFLNPVAQRLSGWSQAEALGLAASQVFRIVNETSREPVASPIERALASGSVIGLANHTVLITRHGLEIPIDDSAAPIRNNENGAISGAVLVFRDITERRRSERQLRESNEQLRQFVAGAAHDLRAPLSSINAVAELMAARFGESLSSDGRELFSYIRTSASRVLRLLEDLLAYAQASNFESEVDAPVSLEAALATALENLRAEIEQTGAEVTAGPLPLLLAREAHLVQLFQNLVGNALKYRSDDPPKVRISAERNHQEWRVQVGDNGIGIAPQYRDEIFKPFKRLHGQEYPGSGIGLAACQKIIAGYGGRIWVDSAPGKGSVFFFTFPVAAKAEHA